MVAGWRKVTTCIWDATEFEDLSRNDVMKGEIAPLTGAYRFATWTNDATRTKPATAAAKSNSLAAAIT